MADKPRNVGASVRARLQNLAAQKGQLFDILLTRYALERFLYRLSRSQSSGACGRQNWLTDIYKNWKRWLTFGREGGGQKTVATANRWAR